MGLFNNIFGRKRGVKLVNEFQNLSIKSSRFFSNKNEIVVTLDGGEIRIINFLQGSVSNTLQSKVEKPDSISVSEGGSRLAVLEAGKYDVEVWDPASGEKTQTIKVRASETANMVAFSPDACRLAVGCYYKPVIHLFNTTSGELDTVLKGHNPSVVQAPFMHRINDMSFSPDGRFLVSVGDDAQAILWDLETSAGETMSRHKYIILRVCFSHSGECFATGGSESWLAQGGGNLIGIREVGTMENDIFKVGAEKPVESIAFCDDDSKIVVTCLDNTVWLWSGHPVAERIEEDFGKILALSPDATRLAAEVDGTLKIWDLSALVD